MSKRSALGLLPPESSKAFLAATSEAGFDPVTASSLGELLRALAERSWSVTVLSVTSEHVDEDVVQRIGELEHAGRLILTAPALSLERAFLSDRAGALALLREPVAEDELRLLLEGALDEGREVPIPPERARPSEDAGPELIGESPVMGRVFETVARVARSEATVLLTGESGTGKEVVARALHRASDRRNRPFIAVNCAAIPEHLLESELFGHEKGAFTGAVARRIGRFERADGGTLFLDEIGDMSLVLQTKVLRALEARTVDRVGGETSKALDVRVIAATNHDLADAMREGRFREDLYYRLAVVELHLPPLRERGGDVRTLALHFAARAAQRHGRPVRSVTAKALDRIESAHWPGNVRELRNVMDRAVLLASGSSIRSTDLRIGAAAPSASAHGAASGLAGYPPTMSLTEVESDHLRRVLESVDGHMARAAETLGIHRNTLSRKVREYGIQAPSPGRAAS